MAAKGVGIVDNEEALAEFEKQLMTASAKVDRVAVELIADGLNPYAIAAALVIRGAAAVSSRFKPDVVLTLIRNSMEKHEARVQ